MTTTSFKPATTEATITRIQELNERLIESSKNAGRVALYAYENALKSILDFQTQTDDASQLEWVAALAATHAQFIKDVSADFIDAAHATLT